MTMEPYVRYLPLVLVLTIILERVRELRTDRQTIPGVREDSLSLRLFLLSGIVGTYGCIAEYVWRGIRPSWPLILLGVVIIIASFVIRRRAIAALGKFWSLHVEMREGHEFVRNGPFRLMRHPVYFSMILELLGLALILNAWGCFAIAMGIFIPTLIRRLRREESALLRQFGAAYEQYQRTTPLLIPWRNGR